MGAAGKQLVEEEHLRQNTSDIEEIRTYQGTAIIDWPSPFADRGANNEDSN